MLVTSPHSRPGSVRSIPLVLEGADQPRARALSQLIADHPHARKALELLRDGDPAAGFSFDDAEDAEVVFNCAVGDHSTRRVRAWLAAGLRIIDLSGSSQELEARLGPHDPNLVFGIPELSRKVLRDASLVVAPGPLVTGATLTLAPAAQAGFLRGSVELEVEHPSARELCESRRSEEVEYQLRRLDRSGAGLRVFLNALVRPGGLRLRAVVDDADLDLTRVHTTYQVYYADADDVLLLDAGQPLGDHDLSDGSVVLAIHEHDDAIQIDCTLDERCRSASQQALRSMNIMFGLPERLGLD